MAFPSLEHTERHRFKRKVFVAAHATRAADELVLRWKSKRRPHFFFVPSNPGGVDVTSLLIYCIFRLGPSVICGYKRGPMRVCKEAESRTRLRFSRLYWGVKRGVIRCRPVRFTKSEVERGKIKRLDLNARISFISASVCL